MTLKGKTKTKIVLASLLKPVNDTRMYEKFGRSLADTGKYELFIIGYHSNTIPIHPAITFYAPFKFRRLSMGRLLAPLKFYIFLLKVKPEVVIVQPPDYLIVTCIFKILFGSKILYDVQENNFLNILHTTSFPLPLRRTMATIVRAIEKITAPAIDHFILAEKVYARQLSFVKNRRTLIENKYDPLTPLPEKHHVRLDPEKPLRLLYTGTIAENYGIFEAIELADQIIRIHPNMTFTIIGRAIQDAVLKKVKGIASERPFIALKASREPVAHIEIIRAIQDANLGILPYRDNPSTKGRIPTKIYEYMAYRLPFLIPDHAEYCSICAAYKACLSINFHDPESARSLLKKLFKMDFYTLKIDQNILWDSEKIKLLHLIQSISL